MKPMKAPFPWLLATVAGSLLVILVISLSMAVMAMQ